MACLVSPRRTLNYQEQTMIKVAIAGTGGLAQYIAHYISTQTYHQFIILSRQVRHDIPQRT
jgi:hypothetical protein